MVARRRREFRKHGDAEPPLDKAERRREMIDFVEEIEADARAGQCIVENGAVAAIAADADEQVVLQVRPCKLPAPGQRMIAAAGENEGVVDQRLER